MRPIDADALINTLQELYDKREKEAKFTGNRGVTVTWNDAIYHIKTAPLIESLPSADTGLDEWCTDCKEYDQERHCCPRWNRVIRNALKDAELERKKGRWHITDAYPHNVYCSECHVKFAQTHWAVWEDGSLPRNFCPNCGADMRGE